jgi:membrane protein
MAGRPNEHVACGDGYHRGVAKAFVALAKDSFAGFQRHRAQWLAAAIAYFTVFAIAPLIIVIVEIGGFVLGSHRTLLDQLYGYLSQTAGTNSAKAIEAIVSTTFNQRRSGLVAQIIGWSIFIFGAIGLFAALQDAMNIVWEVPKRSGGWLRMVRDRAISFGLVIVMALALLVSLASNAAINAGEQALASVHPVLPMLLKVVDFVVTFAIVTGIFGLLYQFLPDRSIKWRDVWPGALLTSLLFVVGESLLGWYLGRAGISSGYGAFGALVVFLLWVNYSTQILLLGAEFARAYATRREQRESSLRVITGEHVGKRVDGKRTVRH